MSAALVNIAFQRPALSKADWGCRSDFGDAVTVGDLDIPGDPFAFEAQAMRQPRQHGDDWPGQSFDHADRVSRIWG